MNSGPSDGYPRGMSLKLGLGIGFAAGYVVGATASDERRRQVQDVLKRVRENPRVQHVGEVAARDAKRIGGAVEERVVRTSSTVADTVSSTLEPQGTGTAATSSTGAGAAQPGPNNTHKDAPTTG